LPFRALNFIHEPLRGSALGVVHGVDGQSGGAEMLPGEFPLPIA
jgi:hypothetical protein